MTGVLARGLVGLTLIATVSTCAVPPASVITAEPALPPRSLAAVDELPSPAPEPVASRSAPVPVSDLVPPQRPVEPEVEDAGEPEAPAAVPAAADAPAAPVDPGPVEPAEPPLPAPPAPVAAGDPVMVSIADIGVAHPLVPVGLHPDRTLVVPDEARVAGWYTGAPRPGELGPAVLVGHNAWRGESGVFQRLSELEPGDVVQVHNDDGTVASFVVYAKEQHPKAAFPTQRVYGNTDRPELRMITCGGPFDQRRRRHLDNIVIYAVLQT